MSNLKNEIENDPLGRGYASMNSDQVADNLNTAYRTDNLSLLSGDVIFQQTDPTEFTNLNQHQQQMWVSFTSRENVDPFSANNVAFVESIFGGGSQTVANLAAARTRSQTRAQELGLGTVRTGDVERARQ